MSLAPVITLDSYRPDPNEYRAEVVSRVAHADPETTRTGATIYNELVHFSDTLGRTIVRELTIAEPNPNLVTVSPYPLIETDPWTTGAAGLNRDKTRSYVDRGYKVFWLHHGGHLSPVAKDKSISRSAHQMHALLNDLRDSSGDDTSEPIVAGYSRGAMTGEKFIAMAGRYGRSVPYSDLEATCFARDMSAREKVETVIKQVPNEFRGLGKIALHILERAIDESNPKLIWEYLNTFHPHPRNIAQETLWAPALINASVGHAIRGLPYNTVGTRTFFTEDDMSQQDEHQQLYQDFPGIQVLTEEGPHVTGAHGDYLGTKYDRLSALMGYMLRNEMSLTGVKTTDVVPTSTAQQESKHRWGLKKAL